MNNYTTELYRDMTFVVGKFFKSIETGYIVYNLPKVHSGYGQSHGFDKEVRLPIGMTSIGAPSINVPTLRKVSISAVPTTRSSGTALPILR